MKSIREFVGRKCEQNASKVTPRGAKKLCFRKRLGPGVPGRGKEFLTETPGSRFAIGLSSSYKQTSSKQKKKQSPRTTAPPSNTHWCASRHGADLKIYWAQWPTGLPGQTVKSDRCRAPPRQVRPLFGISFLLPASIFQIPVSNFQVPASIFHLPVSNFQILDS